MLSPPQRSTGSHQQQALQQPAPGLPVCSAVVPATPIPANLNPKQGLGSLQRLPLARALCAGRAGCSPWDEVGLSLRGTTLFCWGRGGNFGARSGLSFQLGDVGNHETQKATRNSLSWPLCFPSPVVEVLAGLQKPGSPLFPWSTCFVLPGTTWQTCFWF